MRCPEFREVMRSFIDGEVDGLDHELPDGLRDSILGDLAPSGASGASGVSQGRKASLDDLGWRQQLRIAWWAVRRDLSKPGEMLKVAAMAAVLILAVVYLPVFRSGDQPAGDKEAFGHSGPIVQMGEKADWKPGETVPTARLSLSGRLI
jgi:hypothetical protein